MFSGPQIKPWTCQAARGTRSATSRPRTGCCSYRRARGSRWRGPAGHERNSNGAPFQPYDPANPPTGDDRHDDDDEGATVPFIVREETGNIVRDQYKIAALFDPGKPWTPTAAQPQFNSKLVITHGESCDTAYETGAAPACCYRSARPRVRRDVARARQRWPQLQPGHAGRVARHDQGGAIERYGTVRYTIGSGCSGGSLVQQQVANAYPGVYQGITPQCTFTDAWSSAMQYVDYVGLNYLENPTRWELGISGPGRDPAFFDHPNPANPITFTTVIPNSGDPTRSCPGVPEEDVYDENTNPDGVRCTLQDYMVNVFGRDERGCARRRSATSASSTAWRACAGADLAGAVRRPQRQSRRDRLRPLPHRRADGGRPDRAGAGLPHGCGQLRQQPRRGRDHRPARPDPVRSTTSTGRTPCASGSCATSARPRTRSSGGARCR